MINRYQFSLCFFAALGLSFGAFSSAQTLPGATATLQCNLDEEEAGRIDFVDTIFSRADSIVFNAACDKAVEGGNFGWMENSDGFAISGPMPQVFVETEASSHTKVVLNGGEDCVTGVESYIDALAEMTFTVAVNEKNVPQFRPASIPTRVLILGQLSVSVDAPNHPPADPNLGENFAGAAVQFKDASGLILFSKLIETQSGTEEFSISQTVFKDFLIDQNGAGEFPAISFTKLAGVETGTGILSPCPQSDRARAEAQALLDPVFELDQNRFDQTHGADSFPLADFYEIATSPNLFNLLHKDSFEAD